MPHAPEATAAGLPVMPFELETPERSLLGLVVLQTDEVLEREASQYLAGSDANLLQSRIRFAPDVTLESLAAMEHELETSVGLFPPGARFDCLAYACTSGTAVIGNERVCARLMADGRARSATTPLAALTAAVRAQTARRIALLTPYSAPVTFALRDALTAQGLEVAAMASFDEPQDARVARISPASIQTAALALACDGADDFDAMVLACTNLACIDVIAPLEAALGKPVVSSNQALSWHMTQLAGIDHQPMQLGSLWARQAG